MLQWKLFEMTTQRGGAGAFVSAGASVAEPRSVRQVEAAEAR